jgi:hypothetical protein
VGGYFYPKTLKHLTHCGNAARAQWRRAVAVHPHLPSPASLPSQPPLPHPHPQRQVAAAAQVPTPLHRTAHVHPPHPPTHLHARARPLPRKRRSCSRCARGRWAGRRAGRADLPSPTFITPQPPLPHPPPPTPGRGRCPGPHTVTPHRTRTHHPQPHPDARARPLPRRRRCCSRCARGRWAGRRAPRCARLSSAKPSSARTAPRSCSACLSCPPPVGWAGRGGGEGSGWCVCGCGRGRWVFFCRPSAKPHGTLRRRRYQYFIGIRF